MKIKNICLLIAGGIFAAGSLQAATLIEFNFDNPQTADDRTSYTDQSGNGHTVNFNRVSSKYNRYPFSTSHPELNGFDYSGRTRYHLGENQGTNGTVSNLGSINLNLGLKEFTMEGWVYLEDFALINNIAVGGTLWSIGAKVSNSGTNATSVFNLTYTSNGIVEGRFNAQSQGGGTIVFNTGIQLELNSWTHLAYVKHRSSVDIYINGSLVLTATDAVIARSLPETLSSISIASNIYGAFDDFRLSDKALLPSELGYHTPFTPEPIPEPSTTALLIFGVIAGSWKMMRRQRAGSL